MSLIQRKGAQSSQGFGEFSSVDKTGLYIENLFSTVVYTGTGATQTINTGIDVSTKGGMIWIKDRNRNTSGHIIFDSNTSTGTKFLTPSGDGITGATVSTGAAYNAISSAIAYTANGFTLGTDTAYSSDNYYTDVNGYVSWSFRKQSKFFDIVSYTGTGSARTISHNLGSTPGCIIVKRTNTTGDWQVYHSGLTSAAYSIQLNLTNAQASATTVWNSTAPTSSVFSVGTDASVNASGGTYVAYLFASNAGGFGSDGSQNVISCGSFTTDASGNATVNLGYEPQWVLLKSTNNSSTGWTIVDSMRGFPVTTNSQRPLFPNTSGAEATNSTNAVLPTATGFVNDSAYLGGGNTYIYIAIRRGPMKTPTVGTSVFSPVATTADNSAVTTGFVTDFIFDAARAGNAANFVAGSRLTGQKSLTTSTTTAEAATGLGATAWQSTNSVTPGAFGTASGNLIIEAFQRAPGFFDVVCYTGTGVVTNFNHNLGVVPELMIVKSRTQGPTYGLWCVYSSTIGATKNLYLNNNLSAQNSGSAFWNSTAPTASVFTIGTGTYVNLSTSDTYVAYLFASCPGVSKVGSYTGTGATQTINCGFTGGARFVLIKRTDTTGDWYVWDTARGMVSGTDPYLLLNSTAAETNANNVYTTSVGFQIVGTDAGINANGGTYIYLAIA